MHRSSLAASSHVGWCTSDPALSAMVPQLYPHPATKERHGNRAMRGYLLAAATESG
jgi:hypothetical protein